MTTHHTLSDGDPTYVTGADSYRVTFAFRLMPDLDLFDQLQAFIQPEHRRSDGYGVVLLESEEHSATYFGPVRHLEAVSAGLETLDPSTGHVYEFWPRGNAWDALIQPTTWNADRQGILTELHHGGRSAVVYEFLDDADRPHVAFHCLNCHANHSVHLDQASENQGPQDRRWIAHKARKHIRRAQPCRPVDPYIVETVTEVFNQRYGTNAPVVSAESRCATAGPCAQIRHLRARAAAQAGPRP